MNIWASLTQFASLQFAFFFLIVFSICWTIGQRPKSRNVFLLVVSYIFYGQLGMVPLTLLWCSTLFNYGFGNGIAASPQKDKSKWLWSGVGFNLGILAIFKYYDFFRDSIEDIAFFFGLDACLVMRCEKAG